MKRPFFILCLMRGLPPADLLKRPDLRFLHCPSAETYAQLRDFHAADLILSDFSLPEFSLEKINALLREKNPEAPLIILQDQVTGQTRVKFMSQGAADCIASDEIRHLELALDRELKTVRIRRAAQDKRMEAVRSVSARLAHDFNNILAPVAMSAPMLKWDLEDTEFDDIVDTLEQTTRMGADTIHNLLVFGRGTDLERKEISIDILLREIASVSQKNLPPGVRIEVKITASLPIISGDAAKLKQSFLALLENAREAMAGGGLIQIEAAEDPENNGIEVSVRDEGQGMDTLTAEQIFDPFFSTKRHAKKGAGLGLPLALGLVKSHGGNITVESQPGKGSCFRVTLPAQKIGQRISSSPR